MPDAPVNVNLIAGEAWAAVGDLDQAADEFRKTLQVETVPPRAHVFLGEMQAKQGDQEGSQQSFRDALAAFDKLVAADENDPSPRTNRGAFFMRTAQMDEAREDFAAATKLDPRFFWALGNPLQEPVRTGNRRTCRPIGIVSTDDEGTKRRPTHICTRGAAARRGTSGLSGY